MARDKILTLTPEQHKLLGHALALAHAVHSQMGGNGLGVAPGELPAIYDDVDIFVQPGAHGGRGFFSTLATVCGRQTTTCGAATISIDADWPEVFGQHVAVSCG